MLRMKNRCSGTSIADDDETGVIGQRHRVRAIIFYMNLYNNNVAQRLSDLFRSNLALQVSILIFSVVFVLIAFLFGLYMATPHLFDTFLTSEKTEEQSQKEHQFEMGMIEEVDFDSLQLGETFGSFTYTGVTNKERTSGLGYYRVTHSFESPEPIIVSTPIDIVYYDIFSDAFITFPDNILRQLLFVNFQSESSEGLYRGGRLTDFPELVEAIENKFGIIFEEDMVTGDSPQYNVTDEVRNLYLTTQAEVSVTGIDITITEDEYQKNRSVAGISFPDLQINSFSDLLVNEP